MLVPVAPGMEAAWRCLPAAVRNRVGLIATKMAFQVFVSGDAFGSKDQPVPGQNKRIQQMRGEASDASCRRLTDLLDVVEAELPALFDSVGQNPDWAVAMGAKR